MRDWVSGARSKDGKIIVHHINELIGSFLPMVEIDRETLNEKFKEHDGWLVLAAHIIDGQEEFIINILDDEKLEFFDFIDGNGFKINRIGVFSNVSTTLAYVLKVKKCQQEEK